MNDCLFCKIVAGEIPGSVVYQDDELVAFKDIDPKAPLHVLIIARPRFSHTIERPSETCLSAAKRGERRAAAVKLGAPSIVRGHQSHVLSRQRAPPGSSS